MAAALDLVATELLGERPAEVVPLQGGHSRGARARVVRRDGTTAFLKVAGDADARRGYAVERAVYGLGHPYHPRLLAHDDERAALLLEDLGHAHAPPPYDRRQVRALRAALAAARNVRPAAEEALRDLPRLPGRDERASGWSAIADDPAPVVDAGLVPGEWLERSLPALLAAASRADLAGDRLVHGDVQSDHARVVGRRGVFLDWGEAAIGNPMLDTATLWWDVALTGGPAEEVAPDDPAAWAVVLGGVLLHAAALPALGDGRVRDEHRREAPWALRLVASLLELDIPGG